jgi:RHS repeat-associated protein
MWCLPKSRPVAPTAADPEVPTTRRWHGVPSKRGVRHHRTSTRLLRSTTTYLMSTVIFIAAVGISVALSAAIGRISPAGAVSDPWTVATTPGDAALQSVTCVSSTDCWAVGGTYVYPGAPIEEVIPSAEYDSTTIIENWNGSSWSEVSDPYDSTEGSALFGVTCTSSTSCWAVGSDSSGTLIEFWDGTSWTESTEPDDGSQPGTLTSVACASSDDCWAVGSYDGALADNWNGSTWTVSSPTGPEYSALASVACVSSSDCWAVGTTGTDDGYVSPFDSDTFTLAEHWNGTAWSTVSTPDPATDAEFLKNQLYSVTCVSSTDCWAVGLYAGLFADPSLALHWNGSTWSQVLTPDDATGDSSLSGVSCLTSSNCWAVGSTPIFSDYEEVGFRTFVVNWNGLEWQASDSPSPIATGTEPVDYLSGVACSTDAGCWIGGLESTSTDAYAGGTSLAMSGAGTALPPSIEDGETGSGHVATHDPGCTHGKYPVDCSSGDFWHTFTDASVPGPGSSLDLTRTYNSHNAATEGIFGYGWSSSYDMNLVVNSDSSVTITDDDGSQVTAEPNGSGGYSLPTWADSTLSYSSGTYTFAQHQTKTYTFNSSGQLTSIADPSGDATTLSYASGKLSTVTDPASRTLTFAYGSNGLVSSVTDPMGRETTYGYDSSDNLTSVTDPLGRVTSFIYDTSGDHLLLTMTMPNGQSGGPDAGDKVTNTYDSSARVLTQTDPDGQETIYAYTGDNFSSSGGTTTITDSDGNVEVQDYTNGELTSLTKGYGTSTAATTTYAYDPNTLGTASVTDPDANTTSATYDSNGNELTSTNALGNTSTYSYNGFDEQSCAASPLAASPCSALSPPSAITGGGTITPPSSAPPAYVTYTEYDTDGNKIWTTTGAYEPGSGSASYSKTSYDLYNGESVTLGGHDDSCTTSAPSSSLPCATITADAVVTQLAYDSQGDLTSSSTPDGNSGGEVAKTTYSYNTDGEETSSVAPDGNLTGANAGNYTTSKTYDADGELTAATVGGGSGSTIVPRTTTYTYDGDGNRTGTAQSASVRPVGSTSGENSGSSLALTLPTGTRAGDEAVLSTTTQSGSPPMIEHYAADDVYLVAGSGNNVGPNGTQANDDSELDYTDGVVVDPSGDVYVVDLLNNNVEEIAATNHTQWGEAMTAGDGYIVAGSSSGSSGYTGDGGAATSALLDYPTGIALDSAGDLYIADAGNNRIQEVAAATGTQRGQSMTAGDVYTVAGSSTGTSGDSGNGGAATSALLWGQNGFDVAIDSAGDIYICDGSNNAIREVAASSGSQWGQSMTANDIYRVAGGTYGDSGDGGAATSAGLDSPIGIALDSAGDLYIADQNNNRVQEVPLASGTQWGQSMTAHDMYTIAGSSTGTSGDSGDGGAATSADLNHPVDLAFDAAGDLYISVGGNNQVQEVSASSGTHWGQSMTADDIYTVAGSSSGTSGSSGNGGVATSAKFDGPYGLAFDSSGDLYIADAFNSTLRMVAAANETRYPGNPGTVYMVAGNNSNSHSSSGDGSPATPSIGLNLPADEAVDSAGDLYIADQSHNRIQEVPATTGTQWGQSMIAGYIYTIAGSSSGSSGHTGNAGAATSAKLDGPVAVALDSAGDLYIADQVNNRVQEVPVASGTQWGQSMTADDMYTIAGSSSGTAGSSGNGGAAASAELSKPSGLALDASGDLYIGDSNNSEVREVAASTHTDWGQSMTANDIYRIAGGSWGASGDGSAATSAKLDGPSGLTFDSSGDLYIADQGNNRIQEVPAASRTDWGQSMTANDIYTVAGNSSGTEGDSGIGGAATSALLGATPSIAIDSSGDLYISDTTNYLVDEVAATSGTQWGQSMTADDIYTVVGGGSGGDGEPATDVELDAPEGITLDAAGDIFVADSVNSRIREVIAPALGQTVTTPSGWTLQTSESSGATTTDVYTRTLASGDTGVTLDYSASLPKVASLAVYRGVNGSSPVDVSSVGSTSSGTSVAASSLTTTNPGDQLVFVGGASGQGSSPTWTAPSGMTSVTGTNTSGVSDIIANGAGPNPAGSTGSTSASTSSTGALTAIEMALAPGTATTTAAYNADDESTLVTDPDGNATLTCYDGDGNVAETVPPVGVAADSLTPASCPTSYPTDYGDRLATDATTYAYDPLGDKTTVTSPAPAGLSGYETTTNAYDPAGRLTSVTAPPTSTSGGAADDVTAYTYDAAGELLTTTTGSGTGTAATTSYCYDPDGDKTASVAPDGNTSSVATCSSSSPYETSSGYQTGYSYDSLGEMVTQTRPATTWASSGQVTTYTYDADGNQLTTEDPNGVTTTNIYTPLDQLSGTSYSGTAAPTVSDTYDADGNRTQMTDGTGTSSYTYDPFGELTSTENGASKTADYAYDALGNVIGVTYPLGSGATWAPTDTVTYGYDAASKMTSVTDFEGNTVQVSDTADGLPSSMTLGTSSDTISTTYDPTDSASDITLTDSSTTLLGFSDSDEPSGGVASETDTPSSSTSPADFTYDAQSRITQMTPGSGSALSYGEDASSNLTTLPTGATGSYDHASEITSSALSGTTTDYTYDADGDQIQASIGGTTTVSGSYNGARELTSYSNSAADMTAASYDGDGVRASATTTPTGGSSSTQHFVWDENGTVPELLMDSTNAYVYGPGSTPIEQVSLSSGTVKYLVSDALGSVRGVISPSGSLTASTSYDAWGNPETSGGLTSYTPVGFAGGYTDPTGLVYLVNRYYGPASGQFLTVDPEVATTGAAYFYAGDNPVNASDPSGLASQCDAERTEALQQKCMDAINPTRTGGTIKQTVGTTAGAACPSVDSMTDACNSAAWNANNPFSVGTSGVCVAGAAFFYGGGMGSACFVWNSQQVGVTFTAGGGGGYGYGLSAGFESSNAQCLADLGRGFFEVGGGAGFLSGSVATSGKTTVGYGGIGTPGFAGYGGGTWTWQLSF